MPKTVVKGRGTFVIEVGSPARTLSATCELQGHKVKNKANPPPPLYYITDPVNDVTVGSHYDRGHLLAESLGGPTDSYNIVPLNSFLNRRGDWKAMELRIDRMRAQGKVGHLGVTVQYGGGAIPTSFVVRASAGPMGPPSPMNAPALGELQPRFEKAEGSYTWLIANALSPRVPLQVTTEVTEYFRLFKLYWEHEDYEEPEDGSGKYHFLDFINDKERLHNIAKSGIATPFSTKQRLMILAFNAWSNMGDDDKPWITSDDPTDPHQELSMAGCKDSPNIDHLRPKSKGGNNAFSNAQVVSEQQNSKKRAQYTFTEKDISKFRRSQRLRKLAEPRTNIKNTKWAEGTATRREEQKDGIKDRRAEQSNKRRFK